jgi:hypothetical protein
MWMCTLNRRQFAELLRTDDDQILRLARELASFREGPAFGSDQVGVLWPERPHSGAGLPTVLIVEADRCREFLAWALSSLSDLRPLTSFVRLVTPAEAKSYADRKARPFPLKWENVCLGAILGEASSYVGSATESRQVSPAACASTYSFSQTRAWANSLSTIEIQEVGNRWSAARHLTRQPVLSPSAEQLRLPWAVLLSLGTQERSHELSVTNHETQMLTNACRELWRPT